MKYLFTLIATVFLFLISIAQDKLPTEEELLADLSVTGCKCVDTVNTFNKSDKEISASISQCFNEITNAYMMGKQFVNIGDLVEGAEEKDGKKVVNMTLNIDQNSKEYKKVYFDVERYMFENCPSVKDKAGLSEKQSKNSMSDNEMAIKYYTAGIAETEVKNYKGAIDYYKKAVKEDPNFAFAWDNLGLSYRYIGDYDKAIDAYNESLKIDPNGMLPLQNIAIAYIYKEQYKNAIKAYKQLAKIDDSNPEVYYGIGNIYATSLKEYEKGLDNMCKAYNLYIEQKSPYRADAEKIINLIYSAMKENGDEEKFYAILKENNISSE